MTDVIITPAPLRSHGRVRTWWECEPRRLARDLAEVSARFPELAFFDAGAGGWRGRLPSWPFDRPAPDGLDTLLGGQGLLLELRYGHAYPVVPPAIYPGEPEPAWHTRTQARWHVMGDGSLCLLQADAQWSPRDSVAELLLKTAGWHVEYALLEAGVMDAMTVAGIVSDDSRDALIGAALTTTPAVPLSDSARESGDS
jgi:hypothetical protein